MSTVHARTISRSMWLYAGTIAAIGAVVVGRSLEIVARGHVSEQWILFAVMTIASGTFTLKIPSIESRLSVSEIFAFSSVLLFGPDVGAVTVALVGLLVSLRYRHTAAQTLFNFGNLGLSVWLSGSLFFLLAHVPPLFGAAPAYGELLLPLGFMTAAYFLVNSGLTAVAVAIHQEKPALQVWREHFLPLAPSYLAGASVALLLVVAFGQVHFSAIALILPLLLITYLTLYSSFGRLEDAKAHVTEVNRLCLSTVETLATAIDAKDEVTHNHVRRVQQAALALAHALGVTDAQTLKAIEAAALLHDTGKIAVPEHILNKPGKLTPAEFEKMKLHAPIGAEILSSISFPYPVVPIVRHHHENWDGTGYPDRVKGTDIPLGARILSVVDCFDALTSDRPYRRRLDDQAAIAILVDRRGTMYDPLIVDTFVAHYREIMPVSEGTPHPAARVVGGARAAAAAAAPVSPAIVEPALNDDLLAVASLARALSGDAGIRDVGALVWMIVRQVLPCHAMAIFVPDESDDTVVIAHAAGERAQVLHGLRRPMGSGVAGWVAVNRRALVNGDPAMDLGVEVATVEPALTNALGLPLMHNDRLIAVLVLFGSHTTFTDDHLRLLELIGPRLAAAVDPVTAEEDRVLRTPTRQPRPDIRLVRAVGQ